MNTQTPPQLVIGSQKSQRECKQSQLVGSFTVTQHIVCLTLYDTYPRGSH